MKLTRNFTKIILSLLSLTIIVSMLISSGVYATAVEGTNINYTFSGDNSETAGYAEGTITFSSDTAGTYYLYWADDISALKGYYPIDEITIKAGEISTYKFGCHTAIPANATKIIACLSKSDVSVKNAVAIFDIPKNKQLLSGSGDLLYSFNSYSDVHIDLDGYYKNASKNWAQALKFGVDKGTDFIVSSGDMVTNAGGPDSEWDEYERILSESDYVNPVWESDGNHDMRSGVASGLKSFVKASGTDSTIANYDANKPYYYVKEQKTGDIFIFMALETNHNPSVSNEFSDAQMTWLNNLLNEYYGTGVNIYIVEHSPINGFGAGDRMSYPYYKAHLSQTHISTVQFKSLLQKYPKLIWMSGHTHEDYSMGYNYSNESNKACHMIHNPAVAGSTLADESNTGLDYNDGYGYNSQGYYVETYRNQVVFYGANLTDELIYPDYCYIMDGSRGSSQEETNPTEEITTADPNDTTGVTGSTLPAGAETKTVYFANTLKWGTVDCYSWSEEDKTSCTWPEYGAVYYGTNEQGVDLYYCKIPKSHTKIVWNNGNNGYQTVDIELDGVNDFFTPSTTVNSDAVTVSKSVWDYNLPTESKETTEPPVSSKDTETSKSSEDTTASESKEDTTASESREDTTASESREETTASESSKNTQSAETDKPTESTSTDVSKYKLGDVDLSGEVNISDVTAIQKYIAKLVTFSNEQVKLADTDGDKRVSIKDATLIQKLLAKIIKDFNLTQQNENNTQGNVSQKIKNKTVKTGTSTLVGKLTEVKTMLDGYYTFASYDQYQSLKKMYYRYKNNSFVDNENEVVAEFDKLISALDVIAQHIGIQKIYPLGDTYFFENTYNWSTVKCYAWKGSSEIGEWPGVSVQKVGTNQGHDVYGIKFEYAGQYDKVIFNDGKKDGATQTINIDLSKYEFNCFYLNGKKDSEGKLDVGNFNYNSPIQPTTPPITTKNVSDNKRYAMCYYNSSVHSWSDIDTFLLPQSDGTYALDFVTKNNSDINMCIYDNSSERYNCVSDSTSFTYSNGEEHNYALVGSSSRGKSITVNGLSSGLILRLEYNPKNNSVKIICKGSSGVDPTESQTDSKNETYTLYMAPTVSDINAGNIFKVNIKDSSSSYHTYDFSKTNMKFNGRDVYSAQITNPSYNNVIKVQYQVLNSNSEWITQVVDERNTTLSYYSGKIMVCSASDKGTLQIFVAD